MGRKENEEAGWPGQGQAFLWKCNRKKRIVILFLLVIMIICFCYVLIGNPVTWYRKYQLKQAITALDGNGMVTLNEVVPFAWDTVYTFAPYTPRKDIEAVIGFQSAAIQETVSEGMVQLLFVKGDVVAACICGYPENLGYQVTLKHSVEYKDNAVFQIDTGGDFVKLVQYES